MNCTAIENNLINLSFGQLMIALILYWFNIIFQQSKKIHIFGTVNIAIVNLLIGISLAIRWLTHNYFPLSNLYMKCIIFLKIFSLIKPMNKKLRYLPTFEILIKILVQ